MNDESSLIILYGNITSVDDEVQVKILDDAIQRHAGLPCTADGIRSLLDIFERFPTKDGHGVFWSILHFLESIGGFEAYLLISNRRMPSEFGLTMINRLINNGVNAHRGIDLLGEIRAIALNSKIQEPIRKTAEKFLRYQEMRLTRR